MEKAAKKTIMMVEMKEFKVRVTVSDQEMET